MHWLHPHSFRFPSPHLADETGLLAVGGDLRPERLLNAYEAGIFPWYSADTPPLWWSPNPRFVLLPQQIKVSKSMVQVFKKETFTFSVNQNFTGVMHACQKIYRPGQHGTWINEECIESYTELHRRGFAHSVEVWQNGALVGGLYGLIFEHCFYGESMFSEASNASKAGFIVLVKNLERLGFVLIDCQVHTEHLASLGAAMMPRQQFLDTIGRHGHRIPLDLSAHFDPHIMKSGPL